MTACLEQAKPDIITAELRVENMHSHYSAVTVNGREQSRGGVSGDELFAEQVTSTGEFAFLFNVFNGSSRTEFAAPVEAVVGRRRLKRYDFRVRRENNTAWTWFFVGSAINPGYHGSVFVDGASGEVMRLVLQVSCDELDPATPVSEKSIAVLPFENLSSDKENAYFASGVQDEILSNLAKIADLKVISRTSVSQ